MFVARPAGSVTGRSVWGIVALAAVLGLPSLTPAKAPADPAPAEPAEATNPEQTYFPEIAPASDEGANALKGFTLPDGVTGSVWAAEPLLANPVAIEVDHRGRLFVCETYRQKKGVEDNRGHMDWLREDLAATTVEDRAAYIRKYVEDADTIYTAEHDRIRLVTDSNGDGTADDATVYAEGFNTLLSGTGAGVLARPNGDVYYTCIPDLWRLKDTDEDGVADQREALSTGYGVRFAFRGHDMHGLTLGPDGRLYWSIGDRGFHVVTPEGTTIAEPDNGAVFRSELDGTGLELYANGMRNPQELAFDDAGNLFTWDNNSDSGDRARWVHVLRHSDSGWRMYFQYKSDRGPWNREMMWAPRDTPAENDLTAEGVPPNVAAATIQPAYVLPPLNNIGDGPSGLTYDPGVGLPPELRGHFFACDFRGTPGVSGIRHWGNERDGATFKLTDDGEYVWGVLATDATFGPDGSLFVSDWVTGWDGIGKGRVYQFAQEEFVSQESAELLAAGFDELNEFRLAELLNHADRRVRLEAQLELADRNAVDALLTVAEDATADPFARRHALWGYGICVRTHDADPYELAVLATDSDPVIRWWAVRLLGETAPDRFAERFVAALKDEDPRVVREAALALGEVSEPNAKAAGWLREVIAARGADPALFHAAVVGLTATTPPADLAAFFGVSFASRPGLSDDEVAAQNDRLHLAAAVALRRLGDGEALVNALDRVEPEDLRTLLELVRAVVDQPATAGFKEALHRVAARPDPGPGPLRDALVRRIMMANYLAGNRDEAGRVIAFAADADLPASLRTEALAELATWIAPDRIDRVTGRLRPVEEWTAVSAWNEVETPFDQPQVVRDVGFLPVMLSQSVKELLDGPPEVQAAAVALMAQYGVVEAFDSARALASDERRPPAVRVAAIEAVDTLAGSGKTGTGFKAAEIVADVARDALGSTSPAVRAAARSTLVRRDPDSAVETLKAALERGEPLERQRAVVTLAGLRTPESDAELKIWLDRLAKGQAPPEITLELLEAASSRKDGAFGEYLSMYEENRGPEKLDQWTESLVGGDAAAGKEIFFGRSAASCRRCHVAEGSGGEVGPALDEIGAKKDRRYLLESIVVPSAKIAEGFATAVVLTEDGQVRTGVLKDETDDVLTLTMVTGEEVKIPTATILQRADGPSAMPEDIPDSLTKREMRDLVEYLASLKTPAPTDAHGGGGNEE